ncbi:MAG TPA: phage protein NinX family protein [Fluviicoccus sp.]|nr:phage protein NinX family protein [Fluviicoccus sp.]
MADMIEVKTAELEGYALDWAAMVADGWQCTGITQLGYRHDYRIEMRWEREDENGKTTVLGWTPSPSRSWNDGGPLLDKYSISIQSPKARVHRNGGPLHGWSEAGYWHACTWEAGVTGKRAFGWHESLALVAAMRCLVAHKIGPVVLVPALLLEGGA